MREGFEKIIASYGDRIKEERKKQNEESISIDEQMERMNLLLDDMIKTAAQATGTPEKVQVNVFFLEREKQEIMGQLANNLQALEEMHGRLEARGGKKSFESVGEGARKVYSSGEGGHKRYFLRGKKNEGETMITKGEMITDGMWDVEYSMDESVPLDDAQQYFMAVASQKVQDLLDKQIVITEEASDINQGTGLDTAYEAMRRRQEGKDEDSNGILAERMVQSFLGKLSYDHSVPFEILRTDAHLDAEDKIDFIVRVHGGNDEVHNRGVDVKVGIQFTTSLREETIREKEKQIRQVNKRLKVEENAPVHDVVLVAIPIRETQDLYEKWHSVKNNQRGPGGPDALWSKETKRLVFEGVLAKLHNIISEDEITSLWKKIESEMGAKE